MSRTRASLTAAAVLAALVLGGCSDDDPKPKFDPSPSVSPEAPTTTDASAELSPEDTVRAWVEAQNDAMVDGDSTAVRGLATDDCETCNGLIDPIDRVVDAGGRFETDGWAVDRVKAGRIGPTGVTVKAAVTIAGGRTYQSAGAKPVRYDVDHSIFEFRLKRVDHSWRVDFIGFLS